MSKTKLHIIVSTVLFLLIVISYLIMALKFPLAYIVATYEDFFGEWAQVFLFVTLFIISVRLSFIHSRFRLFFIVLATASFYTFMEEISWGQRIFNITPPELFMKHNLQRETNIHNFITGPYSTSLKGFIEYILFTGLIFYGLIYPLLLNMKVRLACWIESKGIPSPPLYLWPYFVISAVLELGIFNFNEAEIAEILIPFGLSIFLLHYLFAYHNNALYDSEKRASLDSSESRKLALAIFVIFFFVAISSTGATYASYSSPRLKNKMDDKLLNGVEKFAGRYKRHGMWNTAIYLYKMIDEKEPGRPSIQRKLAYCYGKSGDTEEESYYIEEALDINKSELEDMPESISVHLSIARTYKQVGNSGRENYHLDRAMDIALKRVKNRPNSASAAYWLGRSYEQRDDKKLALMHYEKAFQLKPQKKKYRQSYMATINALNGSVEADPESTEARKD